MQCTVPECTFATPDDSSENVVCTLLTAHTYGVHMQQQRAPATGGHLVRGPKLEKRKVDLGVSKEEWNKITCRWDTIVTGCWPDATDCTAQQFQCSSEALGDSLLKSYPRLINKPTTELLAAMERLAVIAVAPGVTRADADADKARP